ncbi:MAG TPA: DUF3750 domain-containing protein [Alphaproteobacteria bacterium]|nr:DUF3750 domain-containing protein [Alphaproteobacteria bacterium]
MRIAILTLVAIIVLFSVLLAGPAYLVASGQVDLTAHWSQASRNETGLAPDPATTPEAVVQVYGARAFNWRGAFADHTWVAVKPKDAPAYTVYEVIGWRVWRGQPALAVRHEGADRQWFGHDPRLLVDLRGPKAADLIPRISAAAESYPFPETYRAWPGPNSNTFTAHIGREVPELRLDLPATAVGKDYLGPWTFWAKSPSGTGVQVSLAGLFGLTLGIEDGVKVTLFGLSLGFDPLELAVDLPGIGKVGPGRG